MKWWEQTTNRPSVSIFIKNCKSWELFYNSNEQLFRTIAAPPWHFRGLSKTSSHVVSYRYENRLDFKNSARSKWVTSVASVNHCSSFNAASSSLYCKTVPLILCRDGGDWTLSLFTLGKGTFWAGHLPITGLTHIKRQLVTLTFTPRGN